MLPTFKCVKDGLASVQQWERLLRDFIQSGCVISGMQEQALRKSTVLCFNDLDQNSEEKSVTS